MGGPREHRQQASGRWCKECMSYGPRWALLKAACRGRTGAPWLKRRQTGRKPQGLQCLHGWLAGDAMRGNQRPLVVAGACTRTRSCARTLHLTLTMWCQNGRASPMYRRGDSPQGVLYTLHHPHRRVHGGVVQMRALRHGIEGRVCVWGG